jgi:hypothetical protein
MLFLLSINKGRETLKSVGGTVDVESMHAPHERPPFQLSYLIFTQDLSEGSLFGMVLRKWKPSEIKEIVGFFWMQRDYLGERSDESEKVRKRIVGFWKWVYERYKQKGVEFLDNEDKKILSALGKLSCFLKEIEDENINWLNLSAEFVGVDFNSSFFIKCLDELKDKGNSVGSGRFVGKIFLRMLDKFTPDYDKKHIISIVEYLYGLGDKETVKSAKKICNIYGEREIEFLREIYEKNKDQ